MRYLFSIFLVIFCFAKGVSQEKHFIFIQSDNKLLFYVNTNGKLYSANSSGYVIIPKLSEGEYNLVVGFAENTYPEQSFKCIVGKKDLGFGLKNFGEKGWALFNLQTMDVTMAGAASANSVAVAPPKSLTDEPISFNRKPETNTTPVKADTTPAQPVETKPAETLAEAKTNTETKDSAVAITNQPVITKLDEQKNSEGVTMSFTDANGSKADTIQVIIPSAAKDSVQKIDTATKLSATDSAIAAKIALLNQRQDDVKVIEIDMDAKGKTDSVKTVTENVVKETPAEIKSVPVDTIKAPPVATEPATNNQPVVENKQEKVETPQPPVAEKEPVAPPVTDNTSKEPKLTSSTNFCSRIANEEDYVRLRRKMALENTDEKMIKEAKKVFRDKCFTTHQVKGLSTLFLSDEGRYRFFTASYSFVSDPASYSSLQSEFIDPFYINRFKAIVQ